MGDYEIRTRAGKVSAEFASDAYRVLDSHMKGLLELYAGVAREVARGEYHRDVYFHAMVACLSDLGFSTDGADIERRPKSTSVAEAARNAREDSWELRALTMRFVFDEKWYVHDVVNAADTLMSAISTRSMDVDKYAKWLHNAVSRYREVAANKTVPERLEDLVEDLAKTVSAEEVAGCMGTMEAACADVCKSPRPAIADAPEGRTVIVREVPERVVFNPPATIAFWGDGGKTVAHCSGDEEFSEYVGLLVCIAKRHTKVPRHAMFEDVMAKLLKRAERQSHPKGKRAAEASE